MNLKVYPVVLVLLIGLLSACKKDKDDIVNAKGFKRSVEAWHNFKSSSGNSYKYKVTFGSWTGTHAETTITVSNGIVVNRSYIMTGIDRNTQQVVVLREWTEGSAAVGTNTDGYSAVTLDQVYDWARTDWLKRRAGASTYFEAKNNGMISSAGYVEKGCMDDCFRGITIKSIERL